MFAIFKNQVLLAVHLLSSDGFLENTWANGYFSRVQKELLCWLFAVCYVDCFVMNKYTAFCEMVVILNKLLQFLGEKKNL